MIINKQERLLTYQTEFITKTEIHVMIWTYLEREINAAITGALCWYGNYKQIGVTAFSQIVHENPIILV